MLVCCVKVGTKYGPEYANRLAAMVARHTTRPHRFLCLTDDPAGITCPTVPIGVDLPGWWSKLVLFKPHDALRGERVLFLDLDTVIVGNMDWLFEYAGPFAILRDFYWPPGYGSAVMSIAPGFGAQLWDRFTSAEMGRFPGDQDWIRSQVPTADLWQDLTPGKIVSYKVHVAHGGLNGASVVCFHGVPKPDQLPADDPVRLAWEQP